MQPNKYVISVSGGGNENVPYQNLNNTSVYQWLDYDYDNLYPNKVLANLQSPFHNSIICTKKSYTIGNGLMYDTNNCALDFFFKHLCDDYDINELITRIAEDLIIFGGYALQVRWSADGSKIIRLDHQPFATVRVEKPDSLTGLVNGYWLSANWVYGRYSSSNQYKEYNPVRIGKFDINNPDVENATLLYFGNYTPIIDFYPIPDYFGGMDYLEIDREIANFHKSNVKRGFMPSTIISVPEVLTPDSQRHFEHSINNSFSGSANAGKVIYLYNDAERAGAGISVTPYDAMNNDKFFEYQQNNVIQQIMTAHRLNSPTLAGISGGGGLGGNGSEIASAQDRFMDMVIKPSYQNPILNLFKQILEFNGLSDDITFAPLRDNVAIYGESLLSQILTTDELRRNAGYEPLPNGEGAKLASKQAVMFQDVD